MDIVLDDGGITIPSTFDGAFQRVRDHLGQRWHQQGWAGVRVMHRARNSAQHHGVLPDVRQLQVWTADTDRFVRSLIAASLGVDLQLVTLADAVASDPIRNAVEAAEVALLAGRPSEALQEARSAFALARQEWDRQRERSGYQVPGRNQLDDLTSPTVTAQLERLEDILEVQPFAVDVSEYLWFLALPHGRPHEPEPTPEQVARAISFVFSWVVRWEAFAAHYDLPARRSQFEDLGPPTSDHPELGTRVVDVKVEPIAYRVGNDERLSVSLKLQVADAPSEIVGWQRDLKAALERRSQPLGVHALVGRDGLLSVTCPEPTVDLSQIRDVVRAALDDAQRHVDERAQRHAGWQAASAETLQHFEEAFLPLNDPRGDPIFSRIEIKQDFEPQPWTEPPPVTICAVLTDPRAAAYSDAQFSQELVDAIGHPYNSSGGKLDEPSLCFPSSLDPTVLASAIEAGFRRSEERREARQEESEIRAALLSELEQRVHQVFGV